ncbi:asparagine synthase (glutamine-hydrolyzing) [soil metagenome]
MCGIAGIIKRTSTAEYDMIARMTDRMHHRGPDAEGIFLDGNLGLGHRRLSILDLSTEGTQPMTTENGNSVLVFNGEVYNFKEIRTDLQNLGRRFRSGTDTEVVLNAMAEWGTAAIEKFNGMFALAYFDKTARQLIIARDRLGIKPLYYTEREGNFAFASEIRALRSTGLVRPNLSTEALADYLVFQNILGYNSMFEDVKVFPPGRYCEFFLSPDENALNSSPKFVDFWTPKFTAQDCTYEEARDELAKIFERVIDRQLISDVPIGAYLSGGLDSSAINAVCARHVSKFKSITIGFDTKGVDAADAKFDESSQAQQISNAIGTEHVYRKLDARDLLDVVAKLSIILEEPRVGQSYPNYYAARLAADHVKVVMTGTGGDELFGGYTWRYFLGQSFKSEAELSQNAFKLWNRLVPIDVLKKSALTADFKEQVHLVEDRFKKVFWKHEVGGDNPQLNRLFLFDITTFLHGLLMVDDKINMNFSIESRVPLLDNELIDFALSLPTHMKVDAVNGGKKIFRDALKKLFPSLPVFADKLGFSAPDGSWFKNELRDEVNRQALSTDHPLFKIVGRDSMAQLIGEHMSGKVNRRGLVWSLLTLRTTLDTL